jgi:AraC-like DNA-binding protein
MSEARPPDLNDSNRPGKSLARHYLRGERVDPHKHGWAQVLYATTGLMWVELEGEALIVPPQRGVWLPPGTVHAVTMMSAVEMRNLYLHPRSIRHLSGKSDVFEVNGLLKELITRLAEGGRDVKFQRSAYDLVVLELGYAPRYSLRIALPEAADRRLQLLCRAVIDNPSSDISFDRHAAQVGASVRTLSRLFRRQFGIGFAAWRRQVQLAGALAGLAEGRTVSDVARSLGYRPSSFTWMFRRELGASPTAFHSQQTLAAR